MSLSNTAVPIYYGQFREAVQRGEIPVNQEISDEMNRIDRLIADPDIYYDDQAVEGFVRYCNNELTLTDGSDFDMLLSFKVWSEQVFGWYYYKRQSVWIKGTKEYDGHFETRDVRHRLTNKQYLIVARGSAKSMYAQCIQAYFLVCDTDTTRQITVAPTMKQAEEVMTPFRTAITRHRGDLFDFLTEGSLQNTTGNRALRQRLVATKKGIENFMTGSLLEIRPMRIDKLQGLQVKCATIDEWLSGEVKEDVVGPIEQGATKVPGYFILAISSEGTVRNGPGDDIKMELHKILRGQIDRPRTSIWLYKLDSVEEVADPRMWPKANPNIGITVSWEAYEEDRLRAEQVPHARNDILAKRFGIPLEGHSHFFTYEETLVHARKQDFRGLRCAMGADLSQGDDFCAFTFLFPLDTKRFGVKTRSYITELTLQMLDQARRYKYEQFIAEGTLIIMPDAILDMEMVYDDLQTHILDMDYDVAAMGYDPYNAKRFVELWERTYGEFTVEKVIQGSRTESVPLGELKKLAKERMLIFDELIMQFTMGHCFVIEDTNGNRKLLKLRVDEKIDNVAAAMDALVAYKVHKEAFE